MSCAHEVFVAGERWRCTKEMGHPGGHRLESLEPNWKMRAETAEKQVSALHGALVRASKREDEYKTMLADMLCYAEGRLLSREGYEKLLKLVKEKIG